MLGDMQELLTTNPILQYCNFTQPFHLVTDANQFAIGALLPQSSVCQDKPVAYASPTLNQANNNYSTIEREYLAFVFATKYFCFYLYGRKSVRIINPKGHQ